jgi:hypothetical protein
LGVVDGFVYDITTHRGQLAIVGSFNNAGGVPASRVALWDGAAWTSPGGGFVDTGGSTQCVASFQGELYVGGSLYDFYQGLRYITKWNGSAWESPGGGANYDVFTLVATPDALFMGGLFTTVGDDIGCIGVSRWDGKQWLPLATGINDHVYCVEQFQGEIIIGGRFNQAGDAPARSIARQVDGRWQPMADGLAGTVFDLQAFRGEIIACGYFNNNKATEPRNIARWDGETWQSLGDGFNQWSIARAMTIFQGDLVACGHYIIGNSFPSSSHIARWDGEQWSPMGTGANNFPGTPVALTVYHGRLIAAGASGSGNALPVVAEWNGQRWLPLNGLGQPGYYATVNALAVYQGDLIAAGDFIRPLGIPGRDIARWDGHEWHSMGAGPSLGQGVGGDIWSLAVAGGSLIAGGLFIDMDNLPANSIARWDGESWSAMAGGVRGGYPLVRQLNRIGGTLYVAGGFTIADEQVSAHLARWQIGGSCAGDIAPDSADGEVGIDDLLAIISSWGACPAPPQACPANINTAGPSATSVDIQDLLSVIGGWGPCP